MLYKTAALSSAIAVARVLAQDDLGVDSIPQLRTCIPARLTWHGGEAPYYLQVLEAGSTSAQIKSLLEDTDDTSYTWTVDLPADTDITLGITDSAGNNAYSSVLSITEGSDSCLDGDSNESSAASDDSSAEESTSAADEGAGASASGGDSAASDSSPAAASSGASSAASSAAGSSSVASSAAGSSSAPASSSASESSSATSEDNAEETDSTAPEDSDDDSAASALKQAGVATLAGALAFVVLA